ncbi:lytic murein transglycosylase [Rhizobium sp. YS-1r]|nr:lytic murein transglycosylase [Rhizobium sp. YS-1r]
MNTKNTPLWPAGHLPLKGGDRLAATSRSRQALTMEGSQSVLPISPLEGEMAGRPEGGKAENHGVSFWEERP